VKAIESGIIVVAPDDKKLDENQDLLGNVIASGAALRAIAPDCFELGIYPITFPRLCSPGRKSQQRINS